MKDDLKLITELNMSIKKDESKVKSCTRLVRKLRDEYTIEPQTWPRKITLETLDDTDGMMKKLNKRKYAENWLRKLRKSTKGSLK